VEHANPENACQDCGGWAQAQGFYREGAGTLEKKEYPEGGKTVGPRGGGGPRGVAKPGNGVRSLWKDERPSLHRGGRNTKTHKGRRKGRNRLVYGQTQGLQDLTYQMNHPALVGRSRTANA